MLNLQVPLYHTSKLISNTTHDDQVIAMWLSDKASGTVVNYRGTIGQFFQKIPKTLKDITLADLMYWRSLLELEYMYATANKKLSTVKSLFAFAAGIRYIPFNPAIILKAIKATKDRSRMTLEPTERIISPGEVIKLINSGKSHRDRVLLKTTYLLGLRIQEALDLHWDDIYPLADQAYKLKIVGKDRKIRYNIINKSLHMELKSLRTEGYIFQSNRDKPLSRTMAHYIICDAVVRAGLNDNISFHWLRHCHASHSLSNGASLKSVQQQLGHSSIATTSIYLHDSRSSSDFLNC